MSLNRNREFYLFLRQPEDKDGFGRYIRHSDELRSLFRFLSDKANLELLGYLYRLKYGEYVRRETLVQALRMSGEKIDKALEYLTSLPKNGNEAIQSVTVVNADGLPEKAYGVNMNLGGLLFGILAAADDYVHTACGYKNQVMNRSLGWVEN